MMKFTIPLVLLLCSMSAQADVCAPVAQAATIISEVGVIAAAKAAGTVVAHSSGAPMLTAAKGYVAGSLGPVAGAVAFVTSPWFIAFAVVATSSYVTVCLVLP